MNWTQPLCRACWDAHYPFPPVCLTPAEGEHCCLCGRATDEGIYFRADPRAVPYPSRGLHYQLGGPDGRDLVPCDWRTWAKWMEHPRARLVAQQTIGQGVSVSTVFLGLDHAHGTGPPLLFETMVFGGPLDREMARYTTFDEAEVGHAEMVARVRTALASMEDET